MKKEGRKIKKLITKEYKEKHPKSFELNERARKVLPGGGTRNVAFFKPYPFFVTGANKYKMFDVDGNWFYDCVNNMTALIHGHAFPPIVEALQEQAKTGTVHAAPMEIQIKLAEMITNRVKSVDKIRFCNSGTEATMFALRGSRVAMGKDKIIKFDGAYHGSHDYVEMNVIPDYESDNPVQQFPEMGFPEALANNIISVPVEDVEYLKDVITKHKHEVSAMIIEPEINKIGFCVSKEYMKTARDLTEDNGIHLIFDEVICFRHSVGGVQKLLGVEPDFTAFGKIIGGGLPVGAFGGREDLIDLYNPRKEPHITHSGTFSGNAMTMQAGIAALENYQEKDVERLNKLGERLENGIRKSIQELDLPADVTRSGSLVFYHLFNGKYENAREYIRNMIHMYDTLPVFNLACLNNGLYVFNKACVQMILSTVMNYKVIDSIIGRFHKTLELLSPMYVEN